VSKAPASLVIYTDGACSGNPGPGGWGVLMQFGEKEKEWIHGWKKRGWKNSAKKAVKNVDLWKELDAVNAKFNVNWKWVKGHAGVDGNERADELARLGVEQVRDI